jgi:4'-phosphopantetheinyl transferase
MTEAGRIEVQVWSVSMTDAHAGVAELRAVLSAEERGRADRYRQPADRQRSVVSRGVLRLLLAERLRCGPESVELESTEHGKPVLRHDGGPWFNVSHSGEWILVAISDAGEVGVDVEQIRAVPNLEAIASHYFAREEWQAIRSLPPADRTRAFFACWTRKEAYLKAVGMGLARSLDGFCVSVGPDAPALLSIDGSAAAAGSWLVADAAPAAGYAGAVVAPRGARVAVRRWQTMGAPGRAPLQLSRRRA